jgi:hypothetical protein
MLPVPEFLNTIVHFTAGIHKTGSDDGSGYHLFDIARCTKQPLRWVNRGRIKTASERASAWRHDQVIRAGEAGDTVQEHHDIALDLDQTLGAIERHFCDTDVMLHWIVEG